MCPKMLDKRDEASEASPFSAKGPLEGGAFKTPKTHENFYFSRFFLDHVPPTQNVGLFQFGDVHFKEVPLLSYGYGVLGACPQNQT